MASCRWGVNHSADCACAIAAGGALGGAPPAANAKCKTQNAKVKMADGDPRFGDLTLFSPPKRLAFSLLLLPVFCLVLSPAAFAQEQAEPQPAANEQVDEAEAERRAAEALNAPGEEEPEPAPVAAPAPLPTMNLLELALAGGPLMIPIALMSFLVVLFAIERWLGLRRRKIIPPELTKSLGELAARPGGLDPRQAYKLCQQFPSTTASVLRAVLMKLGRPHAEVEIAVKDASDREATRLYKNVRPIELAVTITPLLGLLGTVQGMIQAFFITANSADKGNMGERLAGGIYVALVTTFAGLSVAIPAAILAHYFEGRIQSSVPRHRRSCCSNCCRSSNASKASSASIARRPRLQKPNLRTTSPVLLKLNPSPAGSSRRVGTAHHGHATRADFCQNRLTAIHGGQCPPYDFMTVAIKKSTALGKLNLTPMIDVVFLLLIFFLVATRFEEQERELNVVLPQASEAMPLTAKPKELFVNVDREGATSSTASNSTRPPCSRPCCSRPPTTPAARPSSSAPTNAAFGSTSSPS